MSHQTNIRNVQRQLEHHERESSRLYKKMRKMLRGVPLQISDHALIRYLERVKGVDLEAIKQEIITEKLLHLYHTLGDGELPNGEDSTRCVICDGVIVTILT